MGQQRLISETEMESTKRDLSLDFTKPLHPRGGQSIPSLVTPVLNLSTPELTKLISNQDQGDLTVLTPNGISSVIPQSNVLPSPLIPTTIRSENIFNNDDQNHNCGANTPTNNNLQNSNKCNGITGNQNQSHKKRFDKSREIDVDKIEKKRERNRLAAKKCRQRKLETIEELTKTVADWKQKYQRLEKDYEELVVKNKELESLVRGNFEIKGVIARRS